MRLCKMHGARMEGTTPLKQSRCAGRMYEPQRDEEESLNGGELEADLELAPTDGMAEYPTTRLFSAFSSKDLRLRATIRKNQLWMIIVAVLSIVSFLLMCGMLLFFILWIQEVELIANGRPAPPKPWADSSSETDHHPTPPPPAFDLSTTVSSPQVISRLELLQKIAFEHGGTRVAGSIGYDLSRAYVQRELERFSAEFTIQTQPFEFDSFKNLDTPTLSSPAWPTGNLSWHADFALLQYSGSGSGMAVPVAVIPNYGCDAADFTDLPAGHVALIRRGDCDFHTKVLHCQGALCACALIFNEGNSPDRMGVFSGTIGGKVTPPVMGITNGLGEQLLSADPAQRVLSFHANTLVETSITHNVIAWTKQGDPTRKVVMGSHLDSVEAGPGISDNGSGSMSNLQVALGMGEALRSGQVTLSNQLGFAFWGAEEEGLLGSEYFVSKLSPSEKASIACNLNYDMTGSPNYFRGIYDGTPGPVGSLALTKMFFAYFDGLGINARTTDFNGRSDYGPFIAAGVDIPAGGLETGAEVIKSEDDRKKFGGLANTPFDPCYHAHCDTIENISEEVLGDNLKAMAYAAQYLGTMSDLRAWLAAN